MTLYAVDSVSDPTPSAIKGDGAVGKIGYISGVPGKSMTPARVAVLHAGDVPVAFVYEDEAADFMQGANMGLAKAKIAAPQLAALHHPQTRPLYCAQDDNITPAQFQITWEGIHAFCSALGKPDACYGPWPFLLWLQETHGVKYLWATGASSENTGQRPALCLQQLAEPPLGKLPTVGGVSVDWDEICADDWGQWPYVVPKPPAPKPTPQPKEPYVRTPVMVTLDLHGNGWEPTTIAPANVVSVLACVEDPKVHGYDGATATYCVRDGKVVVVVTGGHPKERVPVVVISE